jgi:hypothetical protein
MNRTRIRVFHNGNGINVIPNLQHHCKFDYVMNDCVCKCYNDNHFEYNHNTNEFERTQDSLDAQAADPNAKPWWLSELQDAQNGTAGEASVLPANVLV